MNNNIEDEMSAMLGITTYRNSVGFSQAEVYNYCGREDRVVTFSLKPRELKKLHAMISNIWDSKWLRLIK